MPEALRIYNLFPLLAGTVADWTAMLPRIAAMGFNAVYVNPFHYPGFSGSLYAVKDYYLLNPLFRGDAPENDAELLAGFTAACRDHGLVPMMDLVVNHTAKDSELVVRHPDWFAHEPGGGVRSPSAIDPADATNVTVWGDLAEIEFRGDASEGAIIAYFATVLHYYVDLGFRGFRCDAAYKVPARVWRALIDEARSAAPDAVFCAETLGARLDEVRRLEGAGFDYLFNSAKWWDFESPWLLEQYEAFRHIAPSIAFPESHDTPRLAAELETAGVTDPAAIEARYRQAYAFAACFSSGVMMPMGFEFGWRRRLDVVKTRPTDVEPRYFDLSPFIAAVNAMKRETPALNEEGPQQRLSPPSDPVVVLARRTEAGEDWAFSLLNSDDETAQEIDVDALIEAIDGRNLAFEDVTPGVAGPAREPVGLRLVVEPLGVRVLRGHAVARGAAVPDGKAQREPQRGTRPAAGPTMHPEWSPTARIVIEDVYPELDAGRYPVKRVVGDTLAVWADIFRDGHDVIAAVLKYRPERAAEWLEVPMSFHDNDRWVGRVTLTENTRYRYTIEAWTDHFASWRADTLKKREAGQPIGVEFLDGRNLLVSAEARAEGVDKRLFERLLREFDSGDEAGRTDVMLSRVLAQAMARWPDRSDAVRYRRELEVVVDRPLARFAAWYEMFARSQGTEPGRSATFDDGIARLPEVARMGFDVVYLPPIHPIGRINRKGPDNALTAKPGDPGSPYAIGSSEGGHTAVDPALGGIEGFRRFVAACRGYGIEVALDYAIQCAPDHPWVAEHPEWFVFRPDGTIKYAENPPKKYQDIVNVDFYNPDCEGLWRALRDVVLFWIGEGVTTFRVDNPHTKPLPFWEWLIREVQWSHPETIFLSEAFTRPKMMRALAKAGFTQSYSYFTWRNTKQELIEYLVELSQGPSKEYLRPNFFTNTPDILPVFLQRGGRPAFRIRLVLAATLASAYGIYNGYELGENTAIPGTEEYLHSEKYEYKVWDWDRPGHIKDEIAAINRLRRDNPALHHLTNLRFYPADDEQVLFYGKMTEDRSNMVFVAVNLDVAAAREATIEFPLAEMGIAPVETFRAVELLTGTEHLWRGHKQRLRLDPATNPTAIFRIVR
jgi:starch synthase (maltosyl-transferring)